MPPLKALVDPSTPSSGVQDTEDSHANQILGMMVQDLGSQSEDTIAGLDAIIAAITAKPSA